MEIFRCLSYKLLLSLMFILVVSAIDPYSEALLGLKSELVDDYHSLSDWLVPPGKNAPGEVSACSWSGITCNSNKTIVIGLDLSMKNLSGVMTGKQLGVFTELVDLNLSFNSFSGQLPVEIFNLSNLNILDISRNNFSGHFPGGISGLKNLVVFDAFSNSFSGPLPVEVSQLDSLKVFNFAGSYFNGPIPSEYGSFKSLEFLHLGGNFLSGNIPPELGKLKTVTHMEIGYNTFQGSIPRQLGNMSELQYLDIAGANLSGPIPEQLSNLTKLQSLFLFRNQLTGLIPREFSRIVALTNLDLSDNQISGPIPESFVELKNLRLLSLMYNEMNGTVPKGIAELPSLETLLIWNNFFSGSLPLSLGRNSKIKWVDVSTNNFIGSIPPDICSGELGGMIPAKTWSLPPLQNFSASSCSISGNLPPFQSCKSISVIELSMNNLSGIVPKSVSNCQAIERMDLANNNLSGHIPEELANLPALSVLDLSHNSFNGPIPVKFGSSSSLLLLNVSFNDISGSIPSETSFRLMGSTAFVGNPQLCGAPLRPCSGSDTILGSKGTEKLRWVLVLCAGVVILIVASILGIIYFQRGFKGRWKMVSFNGIPRFTAKDVLKSLSSTESAEAVQAPSASVCKAVLPTGITVLVKKIEWEAKRIGVMSEFITSLGNSRHKNLIRLLGFCYNKHLAYLLYDYLPNGNLAEKIRMKMDWATKYKIIVGIAKGLCFLHHDCYPAIPHGDLKSSNIVFDENMETHLAEFGFKYLVQLNKGLYTATSKKETGEFNNAIKEELYMDIYNFGEIILEILTNGKLTNAGASIRNKPKEVLLKDIYNENEVDCKTSLQEEIKVVIDVALICTRSRASDRPSIEDALKFLSGLKPQDNNRT
ncbi:leucine-rich repeat receptor-like protein kinase tdr [Quercus suber]|uniref:Leucine-rich repeat receptor-like protein kinase tdr n=1 Tax=Quercus suber TaxID=58331 RepID=A0AAW0JPC3_QUESU